MAPARLLLFQGSQTQTPGARLAALCPGSAGDRPGQPRDLDREDGGAPRPPGEKTVLMHPSPPVRAPPVPQGTLWGAVLCTESRVTSCLHTLAVHLLTLPPQLSTSPTAQILPWPWCQTPADALLLGGCFQVGFFQAKSGKKVTVPRPGLCPAAAKPGHVFRDQPLAQPGCPGSPPPGRMD